MSVAPNSRAAFATVNLGARQRDVLDAIAELHGQGWRPFDQDIASYLRRPINTITPRRGELADAGHVIKVGDKIGPCGVRVSCWAPVARRGELL